MLAQSGGVLSEALPSSREAWLAVWGLSHATLRDVRTRWASSQVLCAIFILTSPQHSFIVLQWLFCWLYHWCKSNADLPDSGSSRQSEVDQILTFVKNIHGKDCWHWMTPLGAILWQKKGFSNILTLWTNRKWKKVKVKSLSRVQLFATPWTVAYQAPPSMGFSSKSAGVDCHFLLQGIFLTQESNPGSPALQADALPSEPPGKPQKRILILLVILIKWFLLVRHQHLGPRVWNCRRHLVNNLFSFLSHRITSMTIKYGPNSEMKKGWDEVTEEIQYQ